MISIPPLLAAAAAGEPAMGEWLERVPGVVRAVAADWGLAVGDPFVPGGQTAWVAPARRRGSDEELVLKVGWRHFEAEHEADGLRHWDGDGAVRCLADRVVDDQTAVLLLERCVPGQWLKRTLPEVEQDVVIAGLLRRLWARAPAAGHPLRPLAELCARSADSLEFRFAAGSGAVDPGIVREGVALLRRLPRDPGDAVLLWTDLHAENVLSAEREPWLAVDPKPWVGDPCFDVVQHMLNCTERLAADPLGLARRMASLLDLDGERVRLWLFARCAQESLGGLPWRELLAPAARRLAV